MKKKVLSLILATVMLLVGCCIPATAMDLTEEEVLVGEEVAVGAYETPYDDSRYFAYGDYILHFRVIEAENPVGQIMMIHGFALSGYCWTNLAEILAENGYTCVLVDLPGYGYSTRETKDTQFITRTKLVYELMSYLSDDPWIVAGHSMGGFYAQGIMQEYPEAVSDLLLYGTSGNDGIGAGMKAVFTFAPVNKLMGAIMEIFVKIDFIFNMMLKMGLQDDEYYASYDVAAVKDPLSIKGTGSGAIYCFVDVPATDFLALRTCGKDIFYCNGTLDNVIAQDARLKFAAHLPSDAVCADVEGGGHMFIENYAEEVAALTLDFLK
ncbi:MAG: alpha/beta hydrolase [Clostridia bacterium]|nr:alpha/beta hydrolase [Clostridia bacterium]